jgi:hypothetical protein
MTYLFKDITDLGYTLKNDVMGLYVFTRQVGDNIVGFFEILEVNVHNENYTHYKQWGGSRKALPLTFREHVAITKFLNNIGLVRYE